MSGNRNRKLLKLNQTNKKKCDKQNHFYTYLILFSSAFLILFYIFIFYSKSFIAPSPKFSIMLALLSFSVTLSFEINEWCTYLQIYKNKVIKLFGVFPPLLFVNLLFVPILLIYNSICNSIDISEAFSAQLPDIITVVSLILYVFSYVCRKFKTVRYTYLHNKKHSKG